MKLISLFRVFYKNKTFRILWRLFNKLYFDVENKLISYYNLMKDDMLRTSIKHIGRNVRILQPAKISFADRISIGNNVYIGPDSFISAEGGLSIGSNCSISGGLLIYTWNHEYKNSDTIPFTKSKEFKPVRIKDNVWIGSRVTIVPGVTIGEGVIIGMGSVIAKDIPDLAIVGGNPAIVLKYRDKKQYIRAKTNGKFFVMNQ